MVTSSSFVYSSFKIYMQTIEKTKNAASENEWTHESKEQEFWKTDSNYSHL